MKLTLTFPDAASWPPTPPAYYQVIRDTGAWFAPDDVRVTDTGAGTSFQVAAAYEDILDPSLVIDGGFTLVDYNAAGLGSIPLLWFVTEFINGITLNFLAQPNPNNPANGQVIIADSNGGSTNIAPVNVQPGDKFRMKSSWAAGSWTNQVFQNGVLLGTLVSAAPFDPTGANIQSGFDSGSIGGGGQPGAFTGVGDIVTYVFQNPAPIPISYRAAQLTGAGLQDEPIEGDV